MLFAKQGCKVITMNDIATSMGISKRTIYENFSDKRDLLFQCMEYFCQKGDGGVQKVLKSSENVIDTVFQMMKCNIEFAGQAKYNFFNEMQKYFPEIYASTIKKYKEYNLKNLEKMIKKGQDDDVFRDDIDVRIITSIIHEIAMLIINDAFENYGYDKRVIMPEFMYNFTRGICTKKGLGVLDKIIENTKNLK
jgi:AcrR family transcriptional regulator